MRTNLSEHDPDVLFGDQLLVFESKIRQLIRTKKQDSYLLALNELYFKVDEYITNLQQAYYKFQAEDQEVRFQIVEKEALNELWGMCDDILRAEMYLALDINTEFNHPIFISRLEEAIYDPRTIKLSSHNGMLTVLIDLDTTAGPLKDWADAVKATRKTFPRRRSPEPMRSHMWKEKFYGPAREGKTYIKTNKKTGKTRDLTEVQAEKYWNTIATRLELSSSTAPFWHILNYGVAEYNDKTGGTAYPQNVRTNFVGKAIGRIKAKFETLKLKYERIYNAEFQQIAKKYKIRIEQATRILDLIQDKMHEYANMQRSTSANVGPDPLGMAFEYLREHLGQERYLRAERGKLQDLAERLVHGEEINERVSLGHGVRTRTKLVIKQFRGY